MPDLLVLGHANVDVILHVEAFPQAGASQPVGQRHTLYGGTAGNVAVHAAALGCDTALWSRVGQDFPSDWLDAMDKVGLDTTRLQVEAGNCTPTCYILDTPDGAQAYCMDQGAMGHLEEFPPQEAALVGVRRAIHVTTGPPRAYEHILKLAKQRGMETNLDPGQELRYAYDEGDLQRLLHHVDRLWLNAVEAEIACKQLGIDKIQFANKMVPEIIVTHGGDGLWLYKHGHQPLHIPVPEPTQVVDGTGAGDAVRAGTHAALSRGFALEDALVVGQRLAGQVVQVEGGQSATWTWAKLLETFR